jgi:hypothetical protein
MTKSLATFRDLGSFIAGILVGLSIVVPVFAMLEADPGDWQTLWVFGPPIILALGITLQVVATNKPRPRRTPAPELGALPVRFMDLNHVR